MTGEETELDRTVIDEIGDPLQHILRNAADHGLESNEERIKAGKPEVGSIYRNAFREGNSVVIEVIDDGGGIDVEKVKRKAIEKGTITPEQAENYLNKPDRKFQNVLPEHSRRRTHTDNSTHSSLFIFYFIQYLESACYIGCF